MTKRPNYTLIATLAPTDACDDWRKSGDGGFGDETSPFKPPKRKLMLPVGIPSVLEAG